jgi:hypothetical protein
VELLGFVLILAAWAPLLALLLWGVLRLLHIRISGLRYRRILGSLLLAGVLTEAIGAALGIAWTISEGGPGAALLLALCCYGGFALFCLVSLPLMLARLQVSVARGVAAGALVGLPLPVLVFGLALLLMRGATAVESTLQERELRRTNIPVPPAVEAYDLPVPGGFTSPEIYLRTEDSSPYHVVPMSYEPGDFNGVIYHEQRHGFSSDSPYMSMPWEELTEHAVMDVAGGLSAAGYSVYIRNGRLEHTDIRAAQQQATGAADPDNPAWRTYWEPEIAGIRAETATQPGGLVRYHIIPDPAPVGSAPLIMVNIDAGGPRATADGLLAAGYKPLTEPFTGPLFSIVEGYEQPQRLTRSER